MELNQAYWIGGSARSGKSSITKRFDVKNNIIIYHADDYFGNIMMKKTIISKEQCPNLWTIQNEEEHYITRKPLQEYVSIVMGIHKEIFELIKNDILNLTTSNIVIIEGISLLPDLLYDCGISNACFLLSSQDFFEQKVLFRDKLEKENDSKKLNENINSMMEIMRTHIKKNANEFGYKIIPVNEKHTLDYNTKLVAEHFSLQII